MKSWIIDHWIRIQASYWFIPSLMSFGAIFAAVAIVHVDTQLGDSWLRNQQWLFANQPAGARALLSTVAGSMITVAGVTFSMTLLAVSHASAQIGPRLLSGFMRDRGNQFTLGTFIATFLYCLMVLRTVHSGSDDEGNVSVFVPHIAILIAVALAILSVAVLIYFIHHVPTSISVSNVISRVGSELVLGIQNLYPERMGDVEPDNVLRSGLPGDFASNSQSLMIEGGGGYLRVMNSEGLMDVTTQHDLVVELLQRPGDFAISGQPLLRVWPAERLTSDMENTLAGLFSWGIERTREQDALFPVEQLTEVLGKAMSPGVNGQYTAILCLNQFERALAELLRRDVPDPERYDEHGKLRVIALPVTHEEFLLEILHPIRQFVRGDWIVTNHLLNMLRRLTEMPDLEHVRPLLAKASALIIDDLDSGPMVNAEKQSLRKATA